MRARRRAALLALALAGCTAPLTLAEPRGDAGAPPGDAALADVPSFGERPDVEAGDELVQIEGEGGLEDAGDARDD